MKQQQQQQQQQHHTNQEERKIHSEHRPAVAVAASVVVLFDIALSFMLKQLAF